MKRKFITMLLILSMAFLLYACGEKEPTKFTVIAYYDELNSVFYANENELINYDPLDTENFIFLGWYNEDYSVCLDNTPVTADMNIYAKLVKIGTGYNVTYDLNGGELDGKQVKRYVVGKETALPNAKKTPNFEFVGWIVNDDESNVITTISATTYGELTLKAKYIDHNTYCKITYELNGGTMVGTPVTDYRVGDENFINCAYAKKDGYYFKGWYLEPTFDTLVRSISSEFKTDLKLYAKFVEATAANTYVSFLGDSITTFEGEIPQDFLTYYPAGDVTSKERTWWYMAANKLGYTILQNNSYSGSKVSPSTIPAPDSYASCYTRLQYVAKDGENPDVIFIHLGTNDFSNGIASDVFEKAYNEMINMIKYYYDDVKIYVCLLPYNNYGPNYVQIRLAFNSIIVNIANANDLTILDLTTVITEKTASSMIYATCHPNYAGMKAIADYVYKQVNNVE